MDTRTRNPRRQTRNTGDPRISNEAAPTPVSSPGAAAPASPAASAPPARRAADLAGAAGTPARAGAVTSAFRTLVRTESDAASTVLRLTLAVVMFPHGAQKLLGWFGGYGWEGTMGFLTQGMGLPWLVAALVIVIEFFGPIALALGFLSRVAAAGVAAVMIGAVLTSHVQHGFFMNWSGAQAGEGFEFHLLALAITAALMIRGSGALSLDRRFGTSA